MRFNPDDYSKLHLTRRELEKAEADYERLRSAYLDILYGEPEHEVALAMVGADLDRSHSHLRQLVGLTDLPFTHETSDVLRRSAEDDITKFSGEVSD